VELTCISNGLAAHIENGKSFTNQMNHMRANDIASVTKSCRLSNKKALLSKSKS